MWYDRLQNLRLLQCCFSTILIFNDAVPVNVLGVVCLFISRCLVCTLVFFLCYSAPYASIGISLEPLDRSSRNFCADSVWP